MVKAFREIIQCNIRLFPRIFRIAKMYLKKKNSSSDLGWFWSLCKPLMYMVMFYFAMSMGFKGAKDIDGIDCPYFVWLISGMSGWFFISDLIGGGPVCFKQNKALVIKAGYPIPVIPMIPVLTNLLIHLIMVIFVLCIAVILGVRPSIYWVQIPLVTILLILFNYLWSFMFGMLNVVSADIFDFIKAIRPAFFWLSGVLFDSRPRHRHIFLLNPITYLIEGYRSAIAFNEWFWQRTIYTEYFACVMLVMLIITVLLYKRLKNIMAEII